MSKILNIAVRIIYDGRGVPTPEVEVQTTCGLFRASAPSQLSWSRHDVVELRDADKNWAGKGVQKCVDQVRSKLRPALAGLDVQNYGDIDKKLRELDESSDGRLGTIGSNAALPISMACCQAAAAYFKCPLYKFLANQCGQKPKMPSIAISLISGGISGGLTCVREYCVFSKTDINQQLINYYQLMNEIKKTVKQPNISQSGALLLEQDTVEDTLKLIAGWIKGAGLDGKMFIALDMSANDFFDQKEYKYEPAKFSARPKQQLSGAQMIEKYIAWTTAAPAVTVLVDPFYYEDFGNYADIAAKMKKTQIVGCMLCNSRADRVQYMLKHERGCLANSVCIQLAQVGLMSEAVKAVKKAVEMNAQVSFSCSVCEQEDAFAVHAAVGFGSEMMFIGGAMRADRAEKLNELLRIGAQLK